MAGQRVGVGRVALEHLDRHRAALRIAQQAVDDLRKASLAVAVVAELDQPGMVAGVVAAAHVVEHQRAVLEVPLGQLGFDLRLPRHQPIQRLVEFFFGDLAQSQFHGQARRRRFFLQTAAGGQLRLRRDQPHDDQGDRQRPLPARPRGENALQADLPQRTQDGGDMAMRQSCERFPTALDRPGVSPASRRRMVSIRSGGRWERLPRVWCLTFLPSRKDRRSRWLT